MRKALQEIVTRFLDRPWMPTALAVLSLATAAVSAATSEIAGAIASGSVLLALVVVVTYGLARRDRFGAIFEILESENTWDLSDPSGKSAEMTRRNKVRFIQNNVLAVPDYVWGDGELASYDCAPGRKVDEFKSGSRTCFVISLGRLYQRGETLDLTTKRTIRDGFLEDEEWIEIEAVDGTPALTVNILFASDRAPQSVLMTRGGSGRQRQLDSDEFKYDQGRPRLTVKISDPKPRELIKFEWRW